MAYLTMMYDALEDAHREDIMQARRHHANLRNKAQWEALFPVNPARSYVESGAFVKRLTLSALSTIVYHRNMFAQECFEQHKLFDVQVMNLKESSRSPPLAAFLSSCWEQAMDAFDKEYLHQLVLSVYANSNNEETRLESYCFTYEYHGESVHLTLQGQRTSQAGRTTLAQVQEATQRMLRAAIDSTAEEPALPPQYDLVVKLIYTEHYNPPLFEECDAEVEQHALQARVHTGSHTLLFSKLSYPPSYSLDQVSVAQSSAQSSFLSTGEPGPGQGLLAVPAAPDQLYFEVLRCPCESDVCGEDIISSRCIICMYCTRAQHAACFNHFEEEPPLQHCCELCARERPERVCTDPSLVHLNRSRARARCAFRRALDWCRLEDSVTGALFIGSFKGMTEEGLQKLVRKLESAGVLRPLSPDQDPIQAPRLVNKARAAEMLKMNSARNSRLPPGCERLFDQLNISSQESASQIESDRRIRQSPILGRANAERNQSTLADTEQKPAERHDGNIPSHQQRSPVENTSEAIAADSTRRKRTDIEDAPAHKMDTLKKRINKKETSNPNLELQKSIKPKTKWTLTNDEMFGSVLAKEGGVEAMEIEDLPLSGSHNPVRVEQLTVKKAAVRRKRKTDEDEDYKPRKTRKAKK